MSDEYTNQSLKQNDDDIPMHPPPLFHLIQTTPVLTEQYLVEDIWSVVFSPDNTLLLTAGGGMYNTYANVQIWDLPTRQMVGALGDAGGSSCYTVRLHPTTHDILIAHDYSVSLWHWADVIRMTARTASRWVEMQALRPHFQTTMPNEVGSTGTTRQWDHARFGPPSPTRSLWSLTPFVFTTQFGPDGTTILTASSDGAARLWDGRNQEMIATLRKTYAPLRCASFHPDGTLVTTASANGRVYLWSMPQQKLLHHLHAHTTGVNTLAWSPAGHCLATGGSDGLVNLWHTLDESGRQSLTGHHGWVTSLAWSPDGEQIVSGSRDGTLRRWHVGTGTCKTVYTTPDPLWSVAWSPNGAYIAGAGINGNVMIWNVAASVPMS
jgi:WD40 repeat protein